MEYNLEGPDEQAKERAEKITEHLDAIKDEFDIDDMVVVYGSAGEDFLGFLASCETSLGKALAGVLSETLSMFIQEIQNRRGHDHGGGENGGTIIH